MIKRMFHYIDDKSNKFWSIALYDKYYVVNFGKIGTSGQEQKKEFDSCETASESYEKLVREKLKKGYVEISGTTAETSKKEAKHIKIFPADASKDSLNPDKFEFIIDELKNGNIVLGEKMIPIDAPLKDVRKTLDMASVNKWIQNDGSPAENFQIQSDILWYKKTATPVSLTFLNNFLNSIYFIDPEWKSPGTGWDDYDMNIHIANYYYTKKKFIELLGKPDEITENKNKTLLISTWICGDKLSLNVCFESRTPDLSIYIKTMKFDTWSCIIPSRDEYIEEKMAINGKNAYIIRKSKKGYDQFGGLPPWIIGSKWPLCKECKEPMAFVAFFWAHAQHLPLKKHTAMAIFMCNGDFSDDCPSYNPDSGCNKVILLTNDDIENNKNKQPARLPENRPYALNYSPLVYKKRIEFDPEGKDTPTVSKTGGYPDWLQYPEIPCCDVCGEGMNFVGQLLGKLDEELNFGDDGCGYIFICPHEHQAKFLWQCC